MSSLRDAIDHGETGDKVDHDDPATAPLGTDAEAGGEPPSREAVAVAARQEIGRGGRRLERPGKAQGHSLPRLVALLGLVLLAALAAVSIW